MILTRFLATSKSKYRIFWLLVISFACLGSAQNSVSGLVRDNSEPVSFANVILFNAIDSSLVKGSISDEKGRFEISNVRDGTYFLEVSMMGYMNVRSPGFDLRGGSARQMEEIVLSEQILLDEVVVNVEKPLYEQKVDRMVINVESSILAAGSTALEVLERSPGIIVDRQSNTISLVGKSGVTVMINGKISYLPQESIVQLLEGTSSDNIESIELITTPPANLDAEGNAGYINIVMKERTDLGLNGSYSLSGGYGNGATTNNNINFNFRKNRLNVFGNYSFLYRTQGQVFSFSRQYFDDSQDLIMVKSVSDRDPIQRNHNYRIGMDYEISDKTIIGMLLSGYDNKWTMDAVTQSAQMTNQQPSGSVTVYNDERNQWSNISANRNIKHNFKKDGYVSADYDYLHYENENPTNYFNEYFDAEGDFLFDEIVKSDKLTPIDIQVIAGDYSNQLNDKLKLEFGVKGAFSKFGNDVSVEVLEGDEFVEDPTLTSKSDLNERILAAYSSVNYKFSEKLAGKFGLRYEYTTSLLDSDKEGVVVDRKFGELFPSAFLSYSVNDTLSFNGSYSRRISRPGFTQMAPFVICFDPNTFYAGNPAIQPAISNTFNVGVNYKSYVFSAQYTREEGTISRTADFDEELERVIFVAVNFDEVSTFSFTFGAPVRISSWWNTQNTLILLHRTVQNETEDDFVKTDQFSYNFNHTSSFTMGDSWTSEINFNYSSESVFGPNTIAANYAMNIGIQKKISEKWGTLRFNVNDVFESRLFQIRADVQGQDVVSDNKLDFSNRTFLLTYTRSFGNKKLKESRSRRTGAEEERRRVN